MSLTNKKVDSHIGFVTAMVGITCTTLGHFIPSNFWVLTYPLAVTLGLITAAIFGE